MPDQATGVVDRKRSAAEQLARLARNVQGATADAEGHIRISQAGLMKLIADATAAAAETGPRYEHDCDACTFIGRVQEDDIYHCPQGGIPTLVARHGDDGPDYTSGPELDLQWNGVSIVMAIGRPLFDG